LKYPLSLRFSINKMFSVNYIIKIEIQWINKTFGLSFIQVAFLTQKLLSLDCKNYDTYTWRLVHNGTHINWPNNQMVLLEKSVNRIYIGLSLEVNHAKIRGSVVSIIILLLIFIWLDSLGIFILIVDEKGLNSLPLFILCL